MTGPPLPSATAAHVVLARAVADLLDQRRPPPCSVDPPAWTSDDWEEREHAARACRGCPIRRPCDAAGATEPAHVWGGRDRTPTARKASS